MFSTELKTWQKYLVAALLLLGTVSRLYDLGDKAFHHDESIHSFYAYKIATEGRANDDGKPVFGYDPVYHGPFLYHFGAAFFFLFGDSDFTARLPYAVFGIFLLWLVWETRKLVGVPMALGMLGAVALSPLVNYYSRFARNDVYIGTAFFAVAVYAALYLKEKKNGYLILSALFLSIGYCVKENSYIYGFCLGFFAVVWALARVSIHGRGEIKGWFTKCYPFTVLLALYACFSLFTFLFVAVDYRVDPKEHGFVGGLFDIASNAFVSEKLGSDESGPELRKKIQSQTRFFIDPERKTARNMYFLLAFGCTGFLLAAMEFLRHLYSSKDGPEDPEKTRGLERDLIPLGLSGLLLLMSFGLLLFFGLATFIVALVLWIAFEVIRGEYLDLPVDDPNENRVRRIVAPWLVISSGLMVVAMVYLFLFSQMFGDMAESAGKFDGRNGLVRGLYDYIEYWFGHQLGEYRLWGPWWFYIARLLIYEFAFLIVAFIGIPVALGWAFYRFVVTESLSETLKKLSGPFHPFFVFTFWLALFNTLIYAKLHEKAPWLTFHQALPWALIAGGFIGWSLDTFRVRWFRVLVLVGVGPLVALTLKAHLQLNHIEPDSNREFVSQQQADRDIRDTVKMVHRLAAETGMYEKFPIASEDPVEWPFPWYFRHYTNYRVKTADSKAMVQFGDDGTFTEMRSKLGGKYTYRKYLHRSAWIENSMTDSHLPGGQSLWENIKAYMADEKFKGKGFRKQFWDYFFHRETWSDVNPKGGYVYIRKDMLPTLEPVDFPKGSLDPPRPLRPELSLESPGGSERNFRLPRGIAVGPEGELHVVDSLNGQVVVLDAEGNLTRSYGNPGVGSGQLKVDGSWGANSVAVDVEGNCYVADTWNHRICKFRSDGAFVRAWNKGAGRNFFGPRGVTVGPKGNVYVSDTGNGQIEVFTPDGKKVRTIGKKGQRKGDFAEPVGLKFGPDGLLYVAETENERIQILTPNGASRRTILVPGWSFDTVGMEPFIDFLPDGRLIVTLSRKNLIRVYSKDGKSAVNYKIGSTQPIGVAVAPDGKVWFSDRSQNQIMRVAFP